MTAPEQQAAPEQAALRQLSDAEITAELAPLATVIDRVLHITPVRIGDTSDLTAALTLAVAVYMGPLVGDVGEQLAALREQLAAARAENLRLRTAWRNARLRAAGYRDRYHYERKLCHRADIRATAAIRAQLAAEAALAAASLPTT